MRADVVQFVLLAIEGTGNPLREVKHLISISPQYREYIVKLAPGDKSKAARTEGVIVRRIDNAGQNNIP